MATQSNITRDDFNKLAAPFAAKDHEFNRGFIYIEETAVCSRIEEVDLSWEWKTIEVTFANGMATVIGALTINGVTRYGTGQQLAQIDANGVEKNGEAYKGATTDALKRAARLFGIGRYLLQCPKSVKDYGADLDKWLASLKRQNTIAPHMSATTPTSTNKPLPPAWWTDLQKDLRERYSDPKTVESELAKARRILDKGDIKIDSALADVKKAMAEEIPF
jgi:hypothetical protein